jgi:hypothetical protein
VRITEGASSRARGTVRTAISRAPTMENGVHTARDWAAMGLGQRNGAPAEIVFASGYDSKTRDWESICARSKKITARPTSAIKRYNAAKSWIVPRLFAGYCDDILSDVDT